MDEWCVYLPYTLRLQQLPHVPQYIVDLAPHNGAHEWSSYCTQYSHKWVNCAPAHEWCGCSRLGPRHCGPFETLKQTRLFTYHLVLPTTCAIHLVFHKFSHLKVFFGFGDKTIKVTNIVSKRTIRCVTICQCIHCPIGVEMLRASPIQWVS